MLSEPFRRVALSRHHPVVPRAIVAAYVVGALGGIVPTAFLVDRAGAGAGLGASWGLWAYVIASPLVVVYAACAVCAARFQWQVDADLFLAGRAMSRTLLGDTVAGLMLALVMAVAAAAGGAVVGTADAAARGTSVVSSPQGLAVVAAMGAAVWWTALSSLVVALTRSASRGYLGIVLLLLLGMTALQFVDTQPVWNAFGVSPVGVFTLVAGDIVADRRGLETHEPLVAAAALLWLTALAWLVLRTRRRLIPVAARGSD